MALGASGGRGSGKRKKGPWCRAWVGQWWRVRLTRLRSSPLGQAWLVATALSGTEPTNSKAGCADRDSATAAAASQPHTLSLSLSTVLYRLRTLWTPPLLQARNIAAPSQNFSNQTRKDAAAVPRAEVPRHCRVQINLFYLQSLAECSRSSQHQQHRRRRARLTVPPKPE